MNLRIYEFKNLCKNLCRKKNNRRWRTENRHWETKAKNNFKSVITTNNEETSNNY